MKLTKIIATLGPASNNADMLGKLIDAGVDVFRLNFSHGTHEFHAGTFALVRDVAKRKNRHIAILQDLSGPKIRIGEVDGDGILLTHGGSLTFTQNKEDRGQDNKVFVTYPTLHSEVKRGEHILLADGIFEVEVVSINGSEVKTKVLCNGKLTSKKGLNLPYTKLTQSALTQKDIEDVRFGLKLGVDFVALSFVRSAQDIVELRAIMKGEGSVVPIIAKIEKPEALADIDNILEASDGIMVARGDLAIETPMEQVPFVQKNLIKQARAHGKPVIVATQMLESMISSDMPTRAEVTDVSIAVTEGTDAVMLSAETATGAHPDKVVAQMVKIITESEHHSHPLRDLPFCSKATSLLEHSIASSVANMADALKAKIILAPTITGRTPELISRFRLAVPIFSLGPNEKILRRLALYYGVQALGIIGNIENLTDMLEVCQAEAIKVDLLKKGDYAIITSGHPVSKIGQTNLIKAIEII